ncbi:hypothetical protein IMSAGC013_01206 [Lachnospiraceae bacterium]|jgi:hypothetical protein|nr:hypothetical protein IMSAGC013_01206 [Lachnospiraceae bacterium]
MQAISMELQFDVFTGIVVIKREKTSSDMIKNFFINVPSYIQNIYLSPIGLTYILHKFI